MLRLLILLSISTAAMALPEESRIHGGVALVNLGSTLVHPKAPYVKLAKRRVTVVNEDDTWFAVVGLSVLKPKNKIELNIAWQDNTSETRSVDIANKKYAESHITIANKNKVNPPKQDWDRIIRENKRIGKAKRYWLDSKPDFAFDLPTTGRFSSLYGKKRFINTIPKNPHRGLDIAAPTGTPIYSPAKALVVDTGDFFYTGNTVLLAHGAGLVSMYSHLSRIDVKKGMELERGDVLGAIGATGRVTGPHLHWAVGLNGTWVDPIYFLTPENRPKEKAEDPAKKKN